MPRNAGLKACSTQKLPANLRRQQKQHGNIPQCAPLEAFALGVLRSISFDR
jgi:hypothetical protein